MESIDPISAAQTRHQRRVARESPDVNDQRLEVLRVHAAELGVEETISRRERFKSALKKVGSCLSLIGEAYVAEQRRSPYANDGYIHGSFVSGLSPTSLPTLKVETTSARNVELPS